MGKETEWVGWVRGTGTLPEHSSSSFWSTPHLGEEFNLLFMWRLLHSSTADHSLCGKGKKGSV